MINVTFIGDYFTLTTSVIASPEFDRETVIEDAASMVEGYYGWDVLKASNDVEVGL
jgi:hypothetical protein